jgi:hypothetical protein
VSDLDDVIGVLPRGIGSFGCGSWRSGAARLNRQVRNIAPAATPPGGTSPGPGTTRTGEAGLLSLGAALVGPTNTPRSIQTGQRSHSQGSSRLSPRPGR